MYMYYIYTYNCLFLLTLDKKRSKYFKPTKYANMCRAGFVTSTTLHFITTRIIYKNNHIMIIIKYAIQTGNEKILSPLY